MDRNERPHTLHATLDHGGDLWGRLECPYEDMGRERPCRLLLENPEPRPEDDAHYEPFVPADGCYVVQWYGEVGMELWAEETQLDGLAFPLPVAWDDQDDDGPALRLWTPADA